MALVRGSHSSNTSRDDSPNARGRRSTQTVDYDCIRGTLTCTRIPMSASHTSSVHIPRAHKAALALKLPLSIYFFVNTLASQIHEFTPPPPSQLKSNKGFGVVPSPPSTSSSETRIGLRLSIQHRPDDGEVHRTLLGCLVSTCKCLNPPTSPPMHFPTSIFIFVTTDTLHALKNDRRTRSVDHSTLLCKATAVV